MKKTITIIKGDGIGPEIVTEAMRVINAIGKKYNHEFFFQEIAAGGNAIDQYGTSLPKESLEKCLNCDSVLLGAVGGPKWDHVDPSIRPEKALLSIRSEMGLYANLRPAKLFPQLAEASPLKESIVAQGIDFLVVRELIGGVYFGKRSTVTENEELVARDEMSYSEHEIKRIAKIAFETARKRGKNVISVDKANVLDTSRLWRKIMEQVSKDYPDVNYNNMLVDNAAMQIVKCPSQFDVIVTENMFGDILSDEASMITGSIGMIPSSSLGNGTRGMYEPIHGSAPDIAGQNTANPIGTILSAAMMMKYSFNMPEEGKAIETSVNKVLNDNFRTMDIMSPGKTKVSCSEMGALIIQNL